MQVSLLLGKYALKAFDFVKEKDAEQGLSAKFTDQIKDGALLAHIEHLGCTSNMLHRTCSMLTPVIARSSLMKTPKPRTSAPPCTWLTISRPCAAVESAKGNIKQG